RGLSGEKTLMNDADSHAPLLQIRDLSAGYGLVQVLQSISLEVRSAEFLALVGSNGAGKTTLLRVLSGLLPVQSGRIEWRGRSIGGQTPDAIFRQGIVQVPEGRQLFPRMSVQDNLLMGAYRRDDTAAIRTDLEQVYGLFPRMA